MTARAPRKKLVFIDDDPDELESMKKLVSRAYDYVPIYWPKQVPDRATIGVSTPAIFVSDLYVPSRTAQADIDDFKTKTLQRHKKLAKETANAFNRLYPGPRNAKKRMRKTMEALTRGRKLLDEQWSGLGQSPDYGLEILQSVRNEYPNVPFVFYSRKITPDDVVRVLKAGANDAIQKRKWKDPSKLLARLREVIRQATN